MAIIPGVYQAKNAISDDSQQGSKFNSIVNAIVNPANTSLLTGFDPVIEEVSSPNVGTVVTYMPHTVSGTPPLALPNSAGQPLQAWSVNLLPHQEGSGDPAPDNVRPIHGTDKLTITTAGKNLLQILPTESTVSNGVTFTVNADGTISTQGTASGTAVFRHYITASDLPAGEDLALNGVPSGGGWMTIYGLAFCNASGAVIGAADSGSGTTISASRLSELAQVQIVVRDGINANGKLFTPMIRLASITDSSFTPYIAPSQTVLTLPQTVYTGTIGSEGGESRDAVADLGTLSWRRYQFAVGVFVFFANIPERIAWSDIMCECYPVDNNRIAAADLLDKTLGCNINSTYVYIRDDTYSDEQSFVASITGKKLVYLLATPQTFPLTSPTIPTPTGTATTWATAEDGTVESMEVTYLGTV